MAKGPLKIETLTHDEATRRNAPTAELEAFVPAEMKAPIVAAYERRNPDLDPQLVWRGKDVADWSDLVVNAPALYIQEKIHPKALVEDLKRASKRAVEPVEAPDLFADFNGIEANQRTEFYQHDQHWSNRMILGDGLQVMASLAEREGLKGQVQCIYIDPPYGIKFNSNFQWSTTSRDVKDGKADHLTREPEQVKAFRDTWADGIHSYLTYLRDRLTVARDLLHESGSVFVQMGEENLHVVRSLLDEIFGTENFCSLITFRTAVSTNTIFSISDYLIWYAKDARHQKVRSLFPAKSEAKLDSTYNYQDADGTRFKATDEIWGMGREAFFGEIGTEGRSIPAPNKKGYKWGEAATYRLVRAGRTSIIANRLYGKKFASDFSITTLTNLWGDTATSTFSADKIYVVQTNTKVVERCVLMTTDPGDLVLDPTCGSGTTAFVAEQWGRRWITIDTSRVALALARARIMGARYPWYLLADSPEGQKKEAEVTRSVPSSTSTYGRLRHGFVYKRVPHITLRSIATNSEIDEIWDNYQARLEPLCASLNSALGESFEEWQIPREAGANWSAAARDLHAAWWVQRITRQSEIDASIGARADTEYLYDQPYEDNGRVRVAGPFTVESLSPHRVPAVDVDDSLFDELGASEGRDQKDRSAESADFATMVLDSLKKSGVQQAHKADRLVFASMKPWPGNFVCAEGRVRQASEGEEDTLSTAPERRAAILVGPEYGTVSRPDLTAAAREAMEAGFDLLIAAAFNFDAHASEFDKMGALTVLQARINPDLHMPDLANTGAGNLFTVFGEPDIQVHDEGDSMVSIEVAGIDMYKGGQIESTAADDIAAWFIDTDYDYESFFVRHAYFPGQTSDPYKSLRSTLKADIDTDAWESLKRTRSRPFPKPESGRVAVKVINHLGDEVMKVLGV